MSGTNDGEIDFGNTYTNMETHSDTQWCRFCRLHNVRPDNQINSNKLQVMTTLKMRSIGSYSNLCVYSVCSECSFASSPHISFGLRFEQCGVRVLFECILSPQSKQGARALITLTMIFEVFGKRARHRWYIYTRHDWIHIVPHNIIYQVIYVELYVVGTTASRS